MHIMASVVEIDQLYNVSIQHSHLKNSLNILGERKRNPWRLLISGSLFSGVEFLTACSVWDLRVLSYFVTDTLPIFFCGEDTLPIEATSLLDR